MRPPSPYHSYEQIAVMSKNQRRRDYLQNVRMIKILTTIPACICVFMALVYGIIGWLGIAETLYTHNRVSISVLGFLDFLVFAAATAAICIQGENRIVIPIAFLAYVLFDMLLHMKISVILMAMLVYVFYASFKAARHEAEIDLLRQFDDFPFLNTSDDSELRTFRNDDVVRALEHTAVNSIHDPGPKPEIQREEYTSRKW